MMGYYTHYTLTWKSFGDSPTVSSCEHRKPADAVFCPTCGLEVKEVSMDEQISKAIADGQAKAQDWLYGVCPDGSSNDAQKWYEHETQMREFSKCFPTVLFTLEGSGEESGDIWKQYFLDGKMQESKAEINIEPFDKSKLK